MISDEAIRRTIDEEGVPIRIQVGDTTPMLAGWLDQDDMQPGSYERVMASFLREVAAELDRVAEES